MVDDVAPYDLPETLVQYGCSDEHLVELKQGEFLLPGFVDTHTVSGVRVPIERILIGPCSMLLRYLTSERMCMRSPSRPSATNDSSTIVGSNTSS